MGIFPYSSVDRVFNQVICGSPLQSAIIYFDSHWKWHSFISKAYFLRQYIWNYFSYKLRPRVHSQPRMPCGHPSDVSRHDQQGLELSFSKGRTGTCDGRTMKGVSLGSSWQAGCPDFQPKGPHPPNTIICHKEDFLCFTFFLFHFFFPSFLLSFFLIFLLSFISLINFF